MDVARHSDAFGDEAFVLTIEVEHLEAAVAPVGDDELCLAGGALVDPETVRAANLSGSVSGADNRSDVSTIFRVFVDEATAVAVTDEDVPRGEEGDVGGVPAVAVLVLARLLWVVDLPDDATIEVGFGNYLSVDVTDVKEFFPALFPEVKAVGAARPFGAEGLDELTSRVEDADGVTADAV